MWTNLGASIDRAVEQARDKAWDDHCGPECECECGAWCERGDDWGQAFMEWVCPECGTIIRDHPPEEGGWNGWREVFKPGDDLISQGLVE